MTQPNPKDLLEKLKDTDLEFADSDQDLRNRKVTDSSGKHIGHVSALFVDRQDRKIRFLQVGAGGFLGIGEREFLVPVEDIVRSTPDEVFINHTLEHVVNAPPYTLSLIPMDENVWIPYYGYYGYVPYWDR